MRVHNISWQQFTTLEHVQKLPLHEQVAQYKSYLASIDGYILNAPSGGKQKTLTPSGPVGGSGTVVFNGLDVGSGGSYVAVPNSYLDWLPDLGDFTVEWFQYQTVGGGHPRVFSIGPDTGAKYGVSIEGNKVYTWPGANNYSIGTTYVNTWIHIALVRESGSTRCYVNGVQKGTSQANAESVVKDVFSFYIGSDGLSAGDGFTGNITNFRWTNSVVYTGSSFTPVTSPLTVLPETKLLLLGGTLANPVVDASGTNVLEFDFTSWSADSPFA